MKLTRKLIPAFAMLLVSAVLMSTASFAWFSMRETVQATGMKVNAVSDYIYLEISGAADSGAFSDTGSANLAAALKPVAHKDFADASAIAVKDNWYYKTSDDPASPTSSSLEGVGVNSLDGFVASTTFKVQVQTNSHDAENLYVSQITIPTGVKVIVAGKDGYKEFEASADSLTADKVLLNEISKTPEDITVYIYIDGNNTNVYSNNIDNLGGQISLKLSASPKSTAP